MNTIIFLVYAICLSSAYINKDLQEYAEFDAAFKALECDHDKNLKLDVSNVTVYFYDFHNDIERKFMIHEAAQNILAISNLIKLNTFFMFVAGYTSSIDKNTEDRVRKAFQDFPNSYLMIIDHSAYTNEEPNYTKGYERSVTYTYYIGKQLAEMLAGMVQGGISPNNIHCIGYSLGSQMLGYAGYEFVKLTGKKIWRITALDPAGPCYSNSLIENQIRSGAAEYVEIYHCNAGGFGSTSLLGDIDFLLNNGKSQPNCETLTDPVKKISCDHKSCVIVWLATVHNKNIYPAYNCDNYKRFKTNKCQFNKRTIAGFWNPGNATGVYYFSIKSYNFD